MFRFLLPFLLVPISLSAAPDGERAQSLEIATRGSATEEERVALIERSRSGEIEDRSAALLALSAQGEASPDVLAALEKHLDDGNEVIRSMAASALVDLGPEGKAILEKRLHSPLAIRPRLEVLMALRSSLSGLQDATLREAMQPLFSEIAALNYPETPTSPLLKDPAFEETSIGDWMVSYNGGAEGNATIDREVTRNGRGGSLRIEKTNEKGEIVLRSKRAHAVKSGETPSARFYFRADDAPGDAALQFLFEREGGAVFIGDLVRGHAAQSQTTLWNVAPGAWEKRVARLTPRQEASSYHLRLVLKGNLATVWIDDIGFPAAPYLYSYPPGMRTLLEPPSALEEPKVPLEAKIETDAGRPRLMVDGKPVPPIMYFVMRGNFGDYAGMSQLGDLPVMVSTVRLEDDADQRYPPVSSVWTGEGKFDFTTPLAWLDQAARNAPGRYLILNFQVAWPRDWAEKNENELWRNEKGEAGFGTTVHFRGFAKELEGGDPLLSDPRAAKYRWWPSPFSTKALEDAGEAIRRFTQELAKKPYANRVIGCFISGGHDGQFYTTAWPDYSEPAVRAFRQWLKERYHDDATLSKAWGGDYALASVTIPSRDDTGEGFFFDPRSERRFADHTRFQSEQGLVIRETLAKAFKKAHGRPALGMTWQLGGGRGQGADSIVPTSEGLDVLISQPAYERRRPGLLGGLSSAFTSLGHHRRLALKELDLRTWLRAGGEEIESHRLGTALSAEGFRHLVRKEAAQMIAKGHGYWFFDISVGMFRDPEMLETVRDGVRAYQELELKNPTPYQPQVAIAWVDDSAYWVRGRSSAAHFLNQTERYTFFGLKESGVIFDEWNLDDLLNGENAVPYKVVVLPDAFRLTSVQKEAIATRLQRDGRTLVWNYAAGYVDDAGLSDQAVSTVTGIGIRSEAISSLPTLAFEKEGGIGEASLSGRPGRGELSLLIARQGQPDRRLSADTLRFVVDDPQATPIARYDDGKVAIALRKHEGWTSVYHGFPGTLDPRLLAVLSRQAGAHLLAQGPVGAEFNGHFLSLHGLRNGEVRLNLPQPSRLVDFDTGASVAEGQQPVIPLQAGETRWFKVEALR